VTVARDVEVEIQRLSRVEGWLPGTIAAELGVHHDVVERVLDAENAVPKERAPRPSKLDPYKSFLLKTLDKHPRLRATRLYHMIRERGFKGSAKIVRRYVKTVRPRPHTDAYLVCERLPGEQAQIDWGKVGTLAVPGGTRVLWVFLMTLAYSRYRYAELVLDLGVETLRRSLLRAVCFFGGTPREWLFDNTKAVVIERFGDAKRLQRDLLELAAQMHVVPRLCRPRKPTDKGGVERGIRDLKEAHFAARTITSVDRGNRDLIDFIHEVVSERKHPTQPTRLVRDVWEEERARLLPLPTYLPSVDLVTPVSVDKTASVRLATNRYSVPAQYAGGTLTLVADDDVVRILDGDTEIARHARSQGRHQRIDDLAHRHDLVKERRAANAAPVRDHMLTEIPELHVLCERWVTRGRNVGAMTSRTKKLRDLYGVEVLREAVLEMVAHDTHDVGALALLCEQARRRRNLPMPSPFTLPAHVVDVDVVSRGLASYDDDGPADEAP
jgi:transposase